VRPLELRSRAADYGQSSTVHTVYVDGEAVLDEAASHDSTQLRSRGS
jgi:hypothetical protein